MAAVRCPTPCGWTGKRKTDQPRDTVLDKPCPKCGGEVQVGGPAPSRVEALPSGIEVAFWDEENIETGAPQRRTYRVPGIDGDTLPSISTVSGIFDKPGLVPAAVFLTMEGVIELAEDGVDIAKLDAGMLRDELNQRRLSHEARWAEARDRGTDAHANLLAILRGDRVPRMSDYPEDRRPWISAGMKFVVDFDPEVLAVEYFVASLEHGFAGRGDLFCVPRRAPEEWKHLIGLKTRIDFKTVTEWKLKPSGELLPPWDENLIGLAGYDLAAPESGYDESDAQLIVRLGPDGEYAITQTDSAAAHDVFLASLTAYNARRHLRRIPNPKGE